MRSFEFAEARSIVISGDIHGEFTELVHRLCDRYRMTDTLLIVAGDCGFGFEKPGYYEHIYKRVLNKLTRSNNWVVMLRGNHDDPSYFNDEKVQHDRFRCVPDYAVLKACGHQILCVGGAVSVDRSSRRAEISYWKDEQPVFNADKLMEISSACRIDTVITHTAPSFCEFVTKASLDYWLEKDPSLSVDCQYERCEIDRVLDFLKQNGHPLLHWFYGHFHHSWTSSIDGIIYSMLDIMEFKELP